MKASELASALATLPPAWAAVLPGWTEERFAAVQEHAVAEGDRLDNVAARYLGDPELFGRICDANRALRPDALLETIGRRLRITLPEGLPGGPLV